MKPKPKSTSKKFETEARAFEVGDICRIESERNIRHAGQPLNGRYGRIIELEANKNGEMSVHFELQPSAKRRDVSYESARDDYRYMQEYGRRRAYSPTASGKIWIAATALKFVRSEEDEQLKKRLQEARDHAKPVTDWRGNKSQKPGVYNIATGQIEDQGNYAIREALAKALKM